MNSLECVHEARVLDAVLAGTWPNADDTLVSHAAQCAVCGEVVEVAMVLRLDHNRSGRDVQVPVAGQVWWRSAVRARLESAQAATRPMTWLHAVTAAITLGIMLAVAGSAWPVAVEGAGWVRSAVMPLLIDREVAGVLAGVLRHSLVAAIAAAACVVIAPVLLYLALSSD